ncbi:hypothetical protein BBJ28_00009918 [Nothophytophthora sp. Chile5]|nr:hypothetical protein BBJ28_00009918 [Nothophytophthora sp. Chile5]
MGPRASAFIWPYADVQLGFLDVELGYDHLHALAAQGSHRAVRALLRKGMNPNAPRQGGALGAREDEQGDSPMLCAARYARPLEGACEAPSVTSSAGFLVFVSECRGLLGNKDRPEHVKTLEELLHFGGRINQPNRLNQTPLYVACDHEFSTPEAPVEGKNATSLRVQLQQQVDCEAERRARLLEDAEELQRLEDQRVYREQLAKEGARRKARRRRQREEAQQRRNVPELRALAPPASLMETGDEERRCESRNKGDMLLLWEKKVAVIPRARSATSGRPNWVACQGHNALNVDATRAKMQHELLHQCEQLYSSLEAERSRHMRMRYIATAPANANANGLPPARNLSKFLKFFRSRLKTHLENVEADFEDTRSDRLSAEDVYSQKDIKAAITSLCFAVKVTFPLLEPHRASMEALRRPLFVCRWQSQANIRSELQDTINMMALLLRQIFVEAEDSRLALDLDIAMVEDKELLERVEQLTVSEWINGDARGGSAAIGALPRATPKPLAKPEAQAELEKQLQQEKEQHEEEIRAARHTSKQEQEEQEAAHTKELRKLQRKLAQASDRVQELEQQVEDARQHVAQTTQFQNMKRMVNTKNEKLRDLRRRLQRYEPDFADDDCETKNADEDDD